MNRRLHNTYTALATAGVVLALTLMMAVPTTPKARPEAIPVNLGGLEFTYTPAQAGVDRNESVRALARSIEHRASQPVESLADAAALTAELATAAALAGSLGNTDVARVDNEPASPGNKSRRRNRQTLAMPYFSFAPRG